MDAALTERSTRVVSFAKLHRAGERRDRREFLVEGANSVRAALDSNVARTLLVREDEQSRHTMILDDARASGVEILTVTARAADKMADTSTSPGIFAVCDLLDASLEQIIDAADARATIAVGVDIADPGNAGTLIRTADAMGCAGVVLVGAAAVDPHNGKAVRASAGSVFHIPVARRADAVEVIGVLRSAGFAVLATAADGELSLDDADTVLSGRATWLFGNEAHGLSDEVLATADHRVSIPIRGRAESLNIAAAAAMCLYSSARAQHSGPRAR
ncbi:TrmH family RNA methyltransferase [Williamsia phyllosphaerae]|uniref:rRNA methylase n=1 Tax=Williamsia phyllosphaerae TaxID=885042 RepID=A0ABQ1UYP4_9NOCA|nr:RNA methyltransferase [Williamsia phyllosphaerae]GGF30406.1 rRNA methylase [Williamsia phyllosphaerae]